ncbi:MFS transporter [Priestia megaterium]|uniref:MFS transporter n=2 Tax=Priestia megaterium TaxID=1404 RepID=A0ABD4WM48_PRIMG|nr:MFS transporter [Priestia megaterium]MBV6738401.1 MFS transporter [Priestia megaterium]MDD9781289.1 MFS transporter [Priestia megaterium]
MKNPYIKTALGMYVNYFLLGMVNIILAANMPFLTKQLDTDSAGISYIISALGIGRVFTYAICGFLSDKFGRKPPVVISTIMMAIFLIGIPLSPNFQIAFAFAILAGMANSAMDEGTYPALMEIFPKSSGSKNVLVKAFLSLGSFILPLIIFLCLEHGISYGFSFFIPAALYLVNMLFLFTAPFPNHRDISMIQETEKDNKSLVIPKFWKEGIALIIIGFTSNGLYSLPQIWLPTYGQEILNMTEANSVKLLSYYSIGGLVSVLLLAGLLKKFIRPVTILLVYPIITLFSLLVLLTVNSQTIGIVNSFLLGFSTAGVYQLTLTVMAELFWKNKGTITGVVSTAGGLSAIFIPTFTGLIKSHTTILHIFVFDLIITLIGIISAVVVCYRYGKLMKNKVVK